MEFIKPSEISSKIMTLIDESDEFVVIVSPYVKISKWYKLLNKIDSLKKRGIPAMFIVRDDASNHSTFQDLDVLGIDYTSIPNLHCKLYLNEKYAVISSMNLLLSSEINSLELAYCTQNKNEYDELVEFCERYLSIDFETFKKSSATKLDCDWRDYVCNSLSEQKMGRIRVKQTDNGLEIDTITNNYSCFIWNTKQNFLRISGILSSNEYQFLTKHPNHIVIDGFKLEYYKGANRHYDTIWGTYEKSLTSHNIEEIIDSEQLDIAKRIIDFVMAVNKFKQSDFYNYDKKGW